AKYPDVITIVENTVDHEQIWSKLLPALDSAIEQVVHSRKREGESLKSTFIKGLDNIMVSLEKIKFYSPKVVEQYQDRLKEKMIEYTAAVDMDQGLILQEVAIFADKVNIDEEITRLQSHIKGFNQIINEDVPIGRKLDFLVQEMNREINTIGS